MGTIRTHRENIKKNADNKYEKKSI